MTAFSPYDGNYTRLCAILGAPETWPAVGEGCRYVAPGYMDLSLDVLEHEPERGAYRIAIAHRFEQNGDLVDDPDMELRVIVPGRIAPGYPGTVEALTYQDQFGFREVYPEPGKVRPRAKQELNRFLTHWLHNLKHQGHKRQAPRSGLEGATAEPAHA